MGLRDRRDRLSCGRCVFTAFRHVMHAPHTLPDATPKFVRGILVFSENNFTT